MSLLGEFGHQDDTRPVAQSDDDLRNFRTLRFFPELRPPEVRTLFRTTQETTHSLALSKRRKRERLSASTQGFQSLKSLTRSSYDLIASDAMDKLRRKMVEDRMREVEERRQMGGRSFLSPTASSSKFDAEFEVEDEGTDFGKLQHKLRLLSMAYEVGRDRDRMEAFRGRPLSFREFESLIRTGLGVRTTKQQIKALFLRLGGLGGAPAGSLQQLKALKVDGDVFRSYFLGLGEEGRDVRRFKQMEEEKRREEERREKEKAEEEEQAKMEASQVDFDFSEEDLASGLQKVGKVAMSMNPHSFSDRIAMDSFKGTLNPSQFKHQLERSFGFHLTQKEAGALMAHFDDDDSGSIEGSEFIKAFMKIKNTMKRKEEERKRRERERYQKKNKYVPLTAKPLGR